MNSGPFIECLDGLASVKDFSLRMARQKALDREVILDLREKLVRAEQERDAAMAELASMQRGVTTSAFSAMIG